ncbi:subunit A of V-type proton ATPase [Hamiltosporidium tvaerminnensis]|uniref:V-type proton ATPase subunit a n=1 Tax=Hamiltosporidium tvaerminnensis TaxID=1176355 RepID=A0A4Q9L685_9MICR|nr:H(+)-transporting V0 sector ATPase subunit a [Hamiltosporidium tvaerminnensis]TBU02130.1 subunit A of V-type proton ATPase [Hamiltosporidium tvaerminnensis]TBU13325.1 subunit A of V-type proton ATPase [Hamiltosporidium tvaerminnensis]
MLRSEDMEHVTLYFSKDTAKQAITELGNHEMVHFIDQNASLKTERLPFTREIRYLEKLLSRVSYLNNETVKLTPLAKTAARCRSLDLGEVEAQINKHYIRYAQLRDLQNDTFSNLSRLQEDMAILQTVEPLIDANNKEHFVAGIINKEKSFLLEKILWHSLRRNLVIHTFDFESEELPKKVIFLVFTHFKAKSKTTQICTSLSARIINLNEKRYASQNFLNMASLIGQIKAVYQNNVMTLKSESLCISQQIPLWKYFLKKEIKIYEIMNQLTLSQQRDHLVGEGWILKRNVERLAKIMTFISEIHGYTAYEIKGVITSLQGNKSPSPLTNSKLEKNLGLENKEIENYSRFEENPRFEESGDKQSGDKEKIGIKEKIKNKENPNQPNKENQNKENQQKNRNQKNNENNEKPKFSSLPTHNIDIITDPNTPLSTEPTQPPTFIETNEFTHAFQTITNVYGIPSYKEINPAIFNIFTFPVMFGIMFGDVGHGLILLFISLFFIRYKSKLDNFHEATQILVDGRYLVLCAALSSIFFGFLYSDFLSLSIPLFPSQYTVDYIYPFGIDPAWHHSTTGLMFVNSLKMKMSLIFGFCHMLLGMGICYCNFYYRKSFLDIFGVWLPQFLCFVGFVGYLVFLIIYKWLVTYDYPSLISVLVGMFTSPFHVENSMYPGQVYVQGFIFIILCVTFPWMFFAKPLILTHRKSKDLVDVWMHQAISTIEFGIGLISNTSSYLRLWAVSLAHSQLTQVLHTMTLGANNFIVRIFTFPIWLLATAILLIGLEGLSSCLHALRLNWIEFNSKFYEGHGYDFKPLNFMENDEE